MEARGLCWRRSAKIRMGGLPPSLPPFPSLPLARSLSPFTSSPFSQVVESDDRKPKDINISGRQVTHIPPPPPFPSLRPSLPPSRRCPPGRASWYWRAGPTIVPRLWGSCQGRPASRPGSLFGPPLSPPKPPNPPRRTPAGTRPVRLATVEPGRRTNRRGGGRLARRRPGLRSET